MKEKIKNVLVFAAGMAVGAVTLVGAITTYAVYKPGGYYARFGADVLDARKDDDENE